MTGMTDPFPFDFEPDHESMSGGLEGRIRDQERQIAALRRDLVATRNDLAQAHRALDEAQRSGQISKLLTTASLTETRDLCLPHVTKSLLYATVEALDEVRKDEGLTDEYLGVRRRTIEQLERFDAKGVYTLQEERERQQAVKLQKVLIRFGDIMIPRQLLDVDDAVELLSSEHPTKPRVVIDGTQMQPGASRPEP